jgi:hypothetical protein
MTRLAKGLRASALLGVIVLTSCGGGTKGTQHDEGSPEVSRSSLITTLDTFISSSLEVDHLNADALNPADANLYVGDDPYDGTLSAPVPGSGPASWVDWNDLGGSAEALGNHRLLDLDVGNKDPTSFPQSNECVGPSVVLSKMDLTYIAAASNSKYAYFAVQRADNNGDAGYYWLFTRATPHLTAGGGPCKATQQQLTYDISVGDVLLGGHFHPNGTPLLTVYKAVSASTNVTAVDAIDFTNARWQVAASAVAAVAINTTPTAPGTFGAAGVNAAGSDSNGAYVESEIFAEAAVDMSVFTGSATSCGADFYGSVITRSSGAGGTSPDLKDLAGPAKFKFGSLALSAALKGSCNSTLGYSASATLPDGSTVANPTCSWVFKKAGVQVATSNDCSAPPAAALTGLAAGSYTGTVTFSDPVSGCSAEKTTDPADVLAPLDVSLSLAAAAQTCPTMTSDAATYNAVPSGGKPPYSYAWTGATCSGSSCTIDPADSTFCASASVYVTLTDSSSGDSLCASKQSETENYTKVTTVTASDN